MTLGNFWRLYERWMDREDRLNFRSAIIAAYVANSVPRAKNSSRKVVEPRDIIPPVREMGRGEQDQEQSAEVDQAQLAYLEMMFGKAVEFDQLPDYLK